MQILPLIPIMRNASLLGITVKVHSSLWIFFRHLEESAVRIEGNKTSSQLGVSFLVICSIIFTSLKDIFSKGFQKKRQDQPNQAPSVYI